jgi:hypothetical protein
MSVAQRRVLAVVAVMAVMLGLVLVLTRGDDGAGPDQRLAVQGSTVDAPSTTATTAPPAATTLPLVPITTGVPVPDATEAPPPTAPPSATPAAPRTTSTPAGTTSSSAAAPGATTVDGTGAVLGRPAGAALRPVDKAKGCNSANDPGWKVDECGALRSSGTVLLWVVESKGKAKQVLVLKEQTAGQWATLLRAADGTGAAWTKVGVRGEDVSGDGQPELVFGFHGSAADKPLAVDLVDANANVAVHRDLARGIVQAAKGSLTTWSAAGDGYDQSAITYAGGKWQASAPQRIPRSAAPQASSV